MKRYIVLLISLIFILSISGCTFYGDSEGDTENQEEIIDDEEKYDDLFIERPEDTNLEFWITEKFDESQLSPYHFKLYDPYGGYTFYGTGYQPINYNHHDLYYEPPEYYVEYDFTGYPNFVDELHISRIKITDPSVRVFGLTINSPIEEYKEVFKKYNFTVTKENADFIRADRGRLSIRFEKDSYLYLFTYTDLGDIVI